MYTCTFFSLAACGQNFLTAAERGPERDQDAEEGAAPPRGGAAALPKLRGQPPAGGLSVKFPGVEFNIKAVFTCTFECFNVDNFVPLKLKTGLCF